MILDTLRHIVGQVGQARDLNAALNAIVLGVRDALEVAVSSVYLWRAPQLLPIAWEYSQRRNGLERSF